MAVPFETKSKVLVSAEQVPDYFVSRRPFHCCLRRGFPPCADSSLLLRYSLSRVPLTPVSQVSHWW